ncbi:MAG TPA: PIN domain-containing protein [Terriglobales bacterium]|nr:PIN domain-containing protein [Terriglobales bacterium]
MKTRVLDSWAIIEWMSARQPAEDAVTTLLAAAQAGKAMLLISAVNVGEVYYILRKHRAEELAERWKTLAQTLPVTIEVPTLADIWDAALLKGQYPIAYADAFAAALAHKYRSPLVTGDPEFQSVPDLQLDWVGRPTV